MIIETAIKSEEDLDLLCNSLNAQAGRFFYSDPDLRNYLLRAQAAINSLCEILESEREFAEELKDIKNMTTRMAMEALSELSEKINDGGIDLFPKTYYITAIDTAIKELDNYERLLEEMLNYQQQSYVNMEQQRAIQALWYKIFKEGGDAP